MTTPDPSDRAAGPDATKAAEGAASTADRDEPSDDLVVTEHQLVVRDLGADRDRDGDGDEGDGTPGAGGATRALRYRATTGRIVLRREISGDDGFEGHTAVAEVFLTSYEVLGDDGEPDRRRPVTFAFNGGPGSSSVWLHLGVLGPRRVVMGDAGQLLPPPGGLADNPESLLASSDLVFLDPVSTGYSRVREGRTAEEFHGFTGDLESIAEVIRLWTTRHQRWLSPKLLAGESYGTVRAAGLAHLLAERYGLAVNGAALVSTVLDLSTIRFTPGNDRPYVGFLPTYAAIAHYHGAAGTDRSLAEHTAEAREFARGPYAAALAAGARLPAEERVAVAGRVAELTGLSADYVDRVELRPEHERFYAELLRDRRLVVGRLDGRFTGREDDYAHETPSADPAMYAIIGPYTAAINHYLRAELGYEQDLPYETLSRAVHPWSYKEFEGRAVSVADDLATAMRRNPHLRVHVAAGYYDGATPFAATEDTIALLRLPAEALERIEVRYYEGGHMMYVHEPSRLAQSADLAAFVRRATAPRPGPS